MIGKVIFGVVSLLFLVYLLLPGPSSITDFAAIPGSTKSTEIGDTVQVPNLKAYFSYTFREDAIKFYQNNYQGLTVLPFKPYRLNYPPEATYERVKDQLKSTYLEELVYPMRDSLFINGFEPFKEDGKPRYSGAANIEIDNVIYDSKVTLKYYPSSLVSRIVFWLLINLSIILLWKVGKRVITNV